MSGWHCQYHNGQCIILILNVIREVQSLFSVGPDSCFLLRIKQKRVLSTIIISGDWWLVSAYVCVCVCRVCRTTPWVCTCVRRGVIHDCLSRQSAVKSYRSFTCAFSTHTSVTQCLLLLILELTVTCRWTISLGQLTLAIPITTSESWEVNRHTTLRTSHAYQSIRSVSMGDARGKLPLCPYPCPPVYPRRNVGCAKVP